MAVHAYCRTQHLGLIPAVGHFAAYPTYFVAAKSACSPTDELVCDCDLSHGRFSQPPLSEAGERLMTSGHVVLAGDCTARQQSVRTRSFTEYQLFTLIACACCYQARY